VRPQTSGGESLRDEPRTSILRRYPRAIAHLKRQHGAGRLLLVFGDEASEQIGFPSRVELIRRIASHPDVRMSDLPPAIKARGYAVQIETLFRRFRETAKQLVPQEICTHSQYVDSFLEAKWRDVLHSCLYRDIPHESEDLYRRDRVYKGFLDVIRKSPITVTYNLDDSIERLLLHTRSRSEAEERRGFETVVDARHPFRLNAGTVYHPNGYLPSNPLEASFAALEATLPHEFSDGTSGEHAALLHYMTKNTMLFIGNPLTDRTLLQLLRHNAVLNPGHYHYVVELASDADVGDKRVPSAEMHAATALASFEAFNLITLFLRQGDIATLGGMLSADYAELRDLAHADGSSLSYTYYVTGVPGAGKTTTFQHFSSLVAFDEWLDERPSLLSKPWRHLDVEEKEQVDDWIAQQVARKNWRLVHDEHEAGVGIRIVDRCPLDALAFTPAGEWRKKAARLLEAIATEREKGLQIQPGHVILLLGDPTDLRIRAAVRGRQLGATDDYMAELQRTTEQVYALEGVTTVDCRRMTPAAVLKTVARIIFLEPYRPSPLHQRLEQAAAGLLVRQAVK
jgi:hypothetical protein